MTSLVIGIGSPLAGDDIAWRVIDALQRVPVKGATLLKSDRPGTALLSLMHGHEDVLLLDAVEGSFETPLTALDVDELSSHERTLSSHGLGVAEALKLARALDQLPQRLRIYGLSPDGGATVEEMAGSIRSLLL